MTQNSHPLGLFYSQAASRNNAFCDGMTHTATKYAKNKCCDCSIGDKRQENSWRFKT